MSKIQALIAVSIIAAVTTVSGCELVGEGGAECASVLAAEEQVTIEGRDFILETSLWVNLMPPISPEGPDLNIAAKMTAADGDDFPADYDADFVWLLQDDKVVAVEFVEERPRELSGDNIMEKMASTKEKLDPETPVDVVVRIIDTGGEKHYLRASGQTITVTH